jgi:glycogen operon protein
VFLNGDEVQMTTPRGEDVQDDSFLVLFNAHSDPLTFRLPTRRFGTGWKLELSTAEPDAEPRSWGAREDLVVESRSIVVLRRVA